LEGCDAVRQQLLHLRKRWEECDARIAAAERTLETTAASWTAFNRECDELEEWLATVQNKLAATVLQNTLQQKRDRLQSVKVVTIVLWCNLV